MSLVADSTSRISSQFAAVRADLVEAATAVAQALGVQIVDDPLPSTSVTTNNSTLISDDGKIEALRDSWVLGNGIIYKWDDWRLIRNKSSFFIWCDAVALEFRYILV